MSLTVTMPQLGETVTEGTILRWAKQPGDAVAEDEVLLEISTDKVDTEIPSPVSGTLLEILVPEGETVEVGTALAIIAGVGEPIADAGRPEEEGQPVPAPEPAAPAVEPEAAAGVPFAAAAEPTFPAPEPGAASLIPIPVAAEPEPAPPARPSAEPTAGAPAAEPPADLGLLSPVVRKLAGEYDVDLRQVAGTGREGRITRKDVQGYIDRRVALGAPSEPEPEFPVAAEPEPGPEIPVAVESVVEPVFPVAAEPEPEPEFPVAVESAAEPAFPAAAEPEPELEPAARSVTPLRPPTPAAEPAAPAAPPAAGDGVVELDRLRVRIAENMIRSKQTAAHVWTVVEVDFESVEQVRRRHKEAFRQREGFSLTYMPFVARAVIDALRVFPVVNSSFLLEEKQRIEHADVHLGIAVDMSQRGLIVMKIPRAEGLRMRQLGREIRRIAEKARDGKIEPDDVSGSTFTITNPGPYGSMMSAPIINLPNVAILSTDTVAKRPVVVTDSAGNDAIAIRHIGYLGLTWDHRAFDGSTAVLFLRRIKESLETWDWEHELS